MMSSNGYESYSLEVERRENQGMGRDSDCTKLGSYLGLEVDPSCNSLVPAMHSVNNLPTNKLSAKGFLKILLQDNFF